MPEELDPTTARLVSELAASILPALTKSLSSAIPANDFTGAAERMNRTTQDIRIQIEKAVRSGIDDNRAARSVIMQSLGNLLEEISALKRSVDKIPDTFNKAKPEDKKDKKTDDGNAKKLDEISGLMNELIEGVKNLSETYTENRNAEPSQDAPHIIIDDSPSADRLLAAIPALEGLVKAEGKAHSHELEEFSREISALHEQNNIALIHEVRETTGQELKAYGEDILNQLDAEREIQINQLAKMCRTVIIMSGVNIFLMLVMIIIMLMK